MSQSGVRIALVYSAEYFLAANYLKNINIKEINTITSQLN